MTRRATLCRLLSGIAFALLWLQWGCSTVRVRADDTGNLRAYQSYAWSAGTVDEELAQRIEQAVDAQLAAWGMQRRDDGQAEVLVACEVDVELKVRDRLAYYSFHPVERYEEGVLTIAFTDAATEQRIWQGSGRSPLRVVAHGSGVAETTWLDTSEERVWNVREMVRAILERAPRD